MIRFRDTLSRSQPPSWLAGAKNLHRRASKHGELWCCGEPLYLDDGGEWRDIGGGYEVSGPVEAWSDYERGSGWVSATPVFDLEGREWLAPRILDAAGERVFRVAYGPDFLPSLSPEQYRMMDVAKAARDAIAASTSGAQDAGVQVVCRWAAELLGATYRLPADAVAALCIMDDVLAVNVIGAAIGLNCEIQS